MLRLLLYFPKHLVFCFIIRKLLGPDLIIVILTMSEKNIERRLRDRHQKDGKFVDMLMVQISKEVLWPNIYFQLIGKRIEKISTEEENVVTVEIEEGRTKYEVMDLVLQSIDGDLTSRGQTSRVCCISWSRMERLLNNIQLQNTRDFNYKKIKFLFDVSNRWFHHYSKMFFRIVRLFILRISNDQSLGLK